MRRFGGGVPVDKKIFTCPQCSQARMSRPMDHVVSHEIQEFKTKDGGTISLFTDTCDKCISKNYRQYFEPTKSDIRKVLKAMTDETQVSSDVSLEELL